MKIRFDFDKNEIKEGTPNKSGYYAVMFDEYGACWSILPYSKRYNVWNTYDIVSYEKAKKVAILKTSKMYVYLAGAFSSFTDLVEDTVIAAIKDLE